MSKKPILGITMGDPASIGPVKNTVLVLKKYRKYVIKLRN